MTFQDFYMICDISNKTLLKIKIKGHNKQYNISKSKYTSTIFSL